VNDRWAPVAGNLTNEVGPDQTGGVTGGGTEMATAGSEPGSLGARGERGALGPVPLGAVLAIVGVVFVVLRARSALVVHQVWGDMPDSIGYRGTPGGPTAGLVSLTGDAIRPWTVPALYAAVGSDAARAAAQVGASIVAWLALALVVARQVTRPALAAGAFVTLLVVACTWGVIVWDLAILAESLALSLGVGLVAAWVCHLARPSWLTAAMVVGLSTLWLFTRLQHLPVIAAAALAALVLALGPHRRAVGATTAVGLVALTAWGFAVLGPQDRAYAARDGHDVSLFGETFALNLRFVILPDAEATRWFRDRGMPDPVGLEAHPRADTIHVDAWETWPDFFSRYRADADLRSWVESDGRRAFTEWTVANGPGLAMRFGSEVDEVLVPPASSLGYAFPEPILPGPVAALVAPEAGSGRVPFVVLLVLVIGAGLTARRRVRGSRPLLGVGAATLALSGAGLFLAWLGSPVEYARHAVPFSVLLPVGALLVLLAMWDGPGAPVPDDDADGDGGPAAPAASMGGPGGRPTTSTNARTTTMAPTPARAGRAANAPRLTGISTKWYDSRARARVRVSWTASNPGSDHPVRSSSSQTKTGQCQRYRP